MPSELTPEELAAFKAAPGLTPEELAAFQAAPGVPAPDAEGMTAPTSAAPEEEGTEVLGVKLPWVQNPAAKAATNAALDSLVAGASPVLSGAGGALEELGKRLAGGSPRPLVEAYLRAKNERKAELEKDRKDFRAATTAGAMGGYVAQGALLPAATATTMLGRAAQLGGMNAGLSALESFGKAASDSRTPTVAEVVLPAALGFAGGAGTAAASPVLAHVAEKMAAKGLGVRAGISNALRKMGITSEEQVREMGRQALDEKLLPFPFTKGAVAEAAEGLGERAGQEIGGHIDAAEKSGMQADYAKLHQAAQDGAASVGQSAYSKSTQFEPAQQFIDSIPEQANLTPGSFKGARVLKSEAQAGVNWADKSTQQKQIQKEAVRGYTREFLDQVGQAIGPERLAQLKDANRRFGLAENVYELATEASTREAAHRVFGLTGLILGGSAAASGAPGVVAAGVGAAENIARRIGPAATARALDAGSKFLEKYGQHFARATSPAAVAVTDFVLSNRADGSQYRQDKENLAKAMNGEGSAAP